MLLSSRCNQDNKNGLQLNEVYNGFYTEWDHLKLVYYFYIYIVI